MFASLLFLLLPLGISADCFIEQDSPGKRAILNVSLAVDDLHCKILCYLNPACVAYTFNKELKGCAQLGEVVGLTCTVPTKEMLRKKKSCPTLVAPSSVDGGYVQNPSINGSYMLPIMINTRKVKASNSIPCGVGFRAIDLLMPDLSHRIVASYYAANIAWDAELGAWYYKDYESPSIYIRAASCFSVSLADAQAIDADACEPLENFRDDRYGPPSAPYNRTWPCDDSKARQVAYLSAGGNNNTMDKNKALINCVYGTWLFLNTHETFDQTRGIITATCV